MMHRSRPALNNNSLWAATAANNVAFPALTEDMTADTVIIGAGMSGLSTALHLAETNQNVVVLEARTPGFGASGQSGGQVIAGLRHFKSDLAKVYGEEKGAQAHAFGGAAAQATFDIIKRHNIDCDAINTGWIQVADSDTALSESEARVAAWQLLGAPVRMLSRDETIALTGTQDYLGGWIDERGGSLQPLSYTLGLAQRAAALGARIFTNSPAISVHHDGVMWQVKSAHGIVRAKSLLLATNALSDGLWPGLRQMILPVWSFQIATAPLSESDRQHILPGRQAVSDTRRVLRYFRVDRDHRVIVGGKGTMFAPKNAGDFRLQQTMLERLYPQLADMPIEYRWGGEVAVTIGRLPRVLRLGPNGYASLGCNGKGVAWCSALGAPLAEMLTTGNEDVLPIPVSQVAPIPFHALRSIYVAIGSSWLRLRDAMDHPSLHGGETTSKSNKGS
ncbi:MAG: FAD-dependent oxidoreductase [Rhizobiales bacterium]|nr:FAD-dependent oxidoreductase [Hyphomicrobiales bacterium]